MRIHPLCFLLFVVPAIVAQATHTTCFVGCKCDEELAITRKLKVRECDSPLNLTKDALKIVSKKVTVISLRNVVITRIDKDAFDEFDELVSVIIENASIGFIHPEAFHLPELRTLTFTKTTFGESPTLASEYLEEYIFNDCKLSQVPNLDRLPALSFLNLANNFIENIDELTFNNTAGLEEVTLANNSISRFPPNLFSNNHDFNVLNLDDNPLTTFNFELPSNLEFLSLRHCKLSTFDRRTAENLSGLTSLDLSYNEISILPIDAFEPMKDLSTLDLSNNKLVELDDDIFSENTELDKIILNNNPFESLPHFQPKPGQIFQTNSFFCKNCSLKNVKGVFKNMKELHLVDLSDNHLEDIDGVFTEVYRLKEVFLSNNKITNIRVNSFGKQPNLEMLDLSNNPLLPLDPVVFAAIPSLKKLWISGCNLTTLWANHNAELSSLEQLKINKNLLTLINIEDVKIVPNLTVLDLEDNPLICTQDLYDTVNYLVKKSIFLKESSVKTHEEIRTETEIIYSPKNVWKSVLPQECGVDFFEEEITDNELDNDDEDDPTYDDEYEEDDKDGGVEASVLSTNGFNLAKASYILSITSVFILTALLVLFVAVVVTLLILKKNKSFNMHNGNLPRLKIPLWHTTPGQKKHSGSVYKPLSEELSGPRTPIINRYEFKQTPQVHNSLP